MPKKEDTEELKYMVLNKYRKVESVLRTTTRRPLRAMIIHAWQGVHV